MADKIQANVQGRRHLAGQHWPEHADIADHGQAAFQAEKPHTHLHAERDAWPRLGLANLGQSPCTAWLWRSASQAPIGVEVDADERLTFQRISPVAIPGGPDAVTRIHLERVRHGFLGWRPLPIEH